MSFALFLSKIQLIVDHKLNEITHIHTNTHTNPTYRALNNGQLCN